MYVNLKHEIPRYCFFFLIRFEKHLTSCKNSGATIKITTQRTMYLRFLILNTTCFCCNSDISSVKDDIFSLHL